MTPATSRHLSATFPPPQCGSAPLQGFRHFATSATPLIGEVEEWRRVEADTWRSGDTRPLKKQIQKFTTPVVINLPGIRLASPCT